MLQKKTDPWVYPWNLLVVILTSSLAREFTKFNETDLKVRLIKKFRQAVQEYDWLVLKYAHFLCWVSQLEATTAKQYIRIK